MCDGFIDGSINLWTTTAVTQFLGNDEYQGCRVDGELFGDCLRHGILNLPHGYILNVAAMGLTIPPPFVLVLLTFPDDEPLTVSFRFILLTYEITHSLLHAGRCSWNIPQGTDATAERVEREGLFLFHDPADEFPFFQFIDFCRRHREFLIGP